MDRTELNSILSLPIEKSVATCGAKPEAVWLDRHDALVKGTRRCEAIFRMIDTTMPFTLLDVGCGPGFAIPFLEARFGLMAGRYLGIDVSEALVSEARRLWKNYHFEVRDIVAHPFPPGSHDYTAINGVLTAKYSLSSEAMENFAFELLESSWHATKVGMSFNVMSPNVDWKRTDLFHWSLDRVSTFCAAKLSRHINILSDYGLYEFSVQVFRSPKSPGEIPAGWNS